MCGIYGKKGDFSIDFRNKLKHRGPDSEGEIEINSVLLGSNRLAILDLKKGKQPIIHKGRMIVFNGEIYNYKKLREELKGKGYKFKTECDTEILIPMYLEYGYDMLNKLDGQFCFCIYDNGKLFLARDHFGIIPLYYTKDFIFSSEIKPLVEYKKPQINYNMIPTFLKYRYIPTKETLYKDIFKLLPGHYIVVDKDIKITKYYDLKVGKNNDIFSKCVSELRWLFTQCVYERTMSDVPIGTFLSGGLDSSIITALCDDIETFCVGLKKDNEIRYAKYASKKLLKYLTTHTLDKEDFALFNELHIKNKMYPYFVPNEIFIEQLSYCVKKKGIGVLLSGEGADELFCGYDRLYRIALTDYKKAIDNYGYFADDELFNLFGRKPIKLNIKKEGTDLQTFTKFMIKYHLPCLLQRLDYATMQHSVESRPPFVSRKVVEFALNLKDEYKINEVDSKIILKSAFKNTIPEKIISREKVGFPVIVDLYHELESLINKSNIIKIYPGLKNIYKLKNDKLKIMLLYNTIYWLILWEKNIKRQV